MQTYDNAPVLVGVGQFTWPDPDVLRTPVDALTAAARAALDDAACPALAAAVDALGMVRFIADANPATSGLFPRNPGAAMAQRLGLDDDIAISQATIGGNTPQYLVNHFADKLARGEHRAVLIAGAETLATMFHAFGNGEDLSGWAGGDAVEPPLIGQERDGLNDTENAHGLFEPINTYPLFENALAHHLGRGPDEHRDYLAQLSARMSQVAADNPYAWRREAMSAADIGTVGPRNRYVGFPYTRAMNAVLAVDMACAVVLTTAGQARALGIDPSRCVYLHGGVDVNEVWHVSARPQLYRAPAIGLAWEALSAQTGVGVDEVGHFDIYSCFPSAVQIACDEIGLSPLDDRGVTVTGGLPFFGGPGNNYSLHAIAQMVDTLRESANGHGLVTANGLYLTKHSLGLYSSSPPQTAWQRCDGQSLQARVDASQQVALAADPRGAATIETFTVAFGREGPKQGIVIARNDAGERVVANTPDDADFLHALVASDPVGKRGEVSVRNGLNILEL